MLFEINHTTCYSYSQPVYLEPHEFRFQPRSDPFHRLEQFQLQILPIPAGMSSYLDAEGNSVTRAWFTGQHEQLSVSVQSRVHTTCTNPFNFLVEPDSLRIPISYNKPVAAMLEAARVRTIKEPSDPVREFSDRILQETDHELLPYLNRLNQKIFEKIKVGRRERGEPYPPAHTLSTATGACRDLTVLFIDACRSAGLAARFVSGYQEPCDDQEPDLHAWAEVYIPGAGWRGYDPSHGLAIADGHVAIAASSYPKFAAPVSGTFRGEATTSMRSIIQIRIEYREGTAVH